MTRLRVLTAQEIEDPELRATMEKVGEDVALGIYGYCPELFKPFWQFLGRALGAAHVLGVTPSAAGGMSSVGNSNGTLSGYEPSVSSPDSSAVSRSQASCSFSPGRNRLTRSYNSRALATSLSFAFTMRSRG